MIKAEKARNKSMSYTYLECLVDRHFIFFKVKSKIKDAIINKEQEVGVRFSSKAFPYFQKAWEYVEKTLIKLGYKCELIETSPGWIVYVSWQKVPNEELGSL